MKYCHIRVHKWNKISKPLCARRKIGQGNIVCRNFREQKYYVTFLTEILHTGHFYKALGILFKYLCIYRFLFLDLKWNQNILSVISFIG